MQGEQYPAEGSQPVYQAEGSQPVATGTVVQQGGGPLRNCSGDGAARADGARGQQPGKIPVVSARRPSPTMVVQRPPSSLVSGVVQLRGAGPGRPLSRRQRVRLRTPAGRRSAARRSGALRRGRPALAPHRRARRRRHRPGDPRRRVHRGLRPRVDCGRYFFQYRPKSAGFSVSSRASSTFYMLKIRRGGAGEGGFQ